MSKKNKEVNNKEQEEPKQAGKTAESAENKAGNEQKGKEEAPEVDEEAKKIEQKLNTLLKENEELKASVAKEKDDYIRLMADFENFRRHSAEAKLELVSSAAADTIKGLLPVLDDCERAMKMLEENSADEVAKEGTALIFNKLMGYLKTKGLEVIKAKGEKFCDCDACKLVAEILDKKDYLSKKSVWIFGGDGWAYDIGFGGVDHVLAQNKNVNVFVFDTEVYSNTGGQASKASNLGQVAQFAAAGKVTKKKSLAEIAMSYGYVYVAQVAMGANPAQTLKAIHEAEAYDGPSLIIGYSPCEMHSIKKGGMQNCQAEMKKAVECGYWNLFRFNPEAVAGKKFSLDSKEPAGGYQEFLMNEARYASLTRSFPERAEELFKENEQAAMDRYAHLLKLKTVYNEA